MSAKTNRTVSTPGTSQSMGTTRWLVLIALVLVAGGSWIVLSRGPQTQTAEAALAPAPVKGHPAPAITLNNVDGQVVNLSDFHGRPVLINFWATWCPPCRAEMPDFQAIHRELGDKVAIIAVNATAQDEVANVQPFMDEFGITFPVLLDTTGQVMSNYNVRGLPTTIFVDSDGVVQEVFTGAVNKAYIESKLSGL